MGASIADSAAPSRAKQIFGGAAGNLVEWYDWYTYSAFALYFAPRFFPQDDAVAQQLNGAVIFAIGFLMRPLGGWLLGVYADRHGRKAALTLSVGLMCFGSLMIALAPTYDQVGLAAPAWLLAARLVQGLSVGGEYGTSATFMAEAADERRRGFWASFQYVTLIGGQLTALAVLVTMQALFSEAELTDWGWRVPFVIGALCAVLVFWLRRGLVETAAFQKVDRAGQKSLIRRLLAHPRALVTVLAITGGGSLAFYTFTTYMQKYFVLSAGWTKVEATSVSTAALFGFMLLQPAFGALSDRVGRRPLLIGFSLGGMLLAVPALAAIGTARYPYEGLALMFAALCVLSGYTSISGLVKAEMFPAEVRALGVGLPYAFGVALFGGTAESIALAFKAAGLESGFFWYVAAMCGVSLVAVLSLPDTKHNSEN
ncbi:MAG: MFS transporter [Polymorphobacter sp.]|uniref:MFS transporter n=1 Tax=Polymorphobacter sp. TaxID=1909290 RepID=UPI003A895D5C